MNVIAEGKAKLSIGLAKTVSKKMYVFYNPVMALNRSISVLLLNSISKKGMQIGLPLEGSGIRGIRFLKELKKGKIKNIHFNDYSQHASDSIKENLLLNGIKRKDVLISCQDATLFLLGSTGFDYIDIDPFGTPNPFLDAAVKRISRGGILAVTATDTSSLSGTHPQACIRKYWAIPSRIDIMHEIGLRILIRKCQLIGAQFDKALLPIYSYSKDHYMRVFFQCEKGKGNADDLLIQYGMHGDAGPLWKGQLWDSNLAEKICAAGKAILNKEDVALLEAIKDESTIDSVGFFHIPSFKLHTLPKQNEIISSIQKLGYQAAKTHFLENSIRSNVPRDKLEALLSSY